MERWVLAILIGIGLGVVLGTIVARSSIKKDAVHGSALAKVFHYLGAIAFASALPVALLNIVLGQGIGRAFVTAFSMILLSLVILLVYAVFEQPARSALANSEDEGWTEEKARTSGL